MNTGQCMCTNAHSLRSVCVCVHSEHRVHKVHCARTCAQEIQLNQPLRGSGNMNKDRIDEILAHVVLAIVAWGAFYLLFQFLMWNNF